MKIYPKSVETALNEPSKSVVVNVPTSMLEGIILDYMQAHQVAYKSYKLTRSEIVSLILFQGIEATKKEITEMKKTISKQSKK